MRTRRRGAGCLLLALACLGCWSYVAPEAKERLEARRGRLSITVYPVNVGCQGRRTVGDFQLGRELVDWLNARQLADATPGRPGAPVPVQWHANQAKMAQESAEAFGAWVKQAGIATDYALLAELLCNHDESAILGVHWYLAERSGLLAAGGLANSHWDVFQRVKPADRRGGLAVLEALLEERWGGAKQP